MTNTCPQPAAGMTHVTPTTQQPPCLIPLVPTPPLPHCRHRAELLSLSPPLAAGEGGPSVMDSGEGLLLVKKMVYELKEVDVSSPK